VALARRLAGVLWAMWRDGRPYDMGRVATASAHGTERAALSAKEQGEAMRVIAQKVRARAGRIRARIVKEVSA
jgi:transposase